MKYKVFVDGSEGTTGLKINERLALQPNVELLTIDSNLRKEPAERAKLLNTADIAFLCLPDAAAKEAVQLVANPNTRIIDASTAHRTNPEWAYGFPELHAKAREEIRCSHRVAVPGCYATGFLSIVYPLVNGGIMPADYPVSCQATSGYSGGGKKLIAKYEAERALHDELEGLQYYALGLCHKHLPEMHKISGLTNPPLFYPAVGDFFNGMLVTVPIHRRLLSKERTAEEIHRFYTNYYKDEKFIKVIPLDGESALNSGFLNCTGCNGTNNLQLFVFHHEDHLLIAARLDNLGKGASGAAVQCMNIMLGQDESIGLLSE
jgi:N-acetyl-gamma-glutamyl-phosphate reductase